MTDDLRELAERINGWEVPPKDLSPVLRKGRRQQRARYIGGAGLLLVLSLGAVLGYRALDEVEPVSPAAGTTFDWVEEVAHRNGVIVEPAEVDSTWKHDPEDVHDPDGHLRPPFESDPVAVLVTSPTLDRGLERARAWATFIDGDAPGPVLADDGSGGAQRVLLTLVLDRGGTVFLPAAPPYENWDAGDVENDPSSEPSAFWVDHEWEGLLFEHPSNWRRAQLAFDPGGSVTSISTVTLTNLSGLPPRKGGGGTVQTGYDMSAEPGDTVIVEITGFEGGPVIGDEVRTTEEAGVATTGGRVEGGFFAKFGDKAVNVWFHVGPDASDAQRAAADRMLSSLGEAPPPAPGFRRYSFTLGEARWGGTLEVSPDARFVCVGLSATFDELHLHRVGDPDPISTWFPAIGDGLDYCLRNVAETTIESLMFGPDGFEIEAHGGQLDGDRAPLQELGEAEHAPRTSMAFGRLPDVAFPPCPSGDFSAGVSDDDARDIAERIMEASNGPKADPQALWKLLDSSLRASIGEFKDLRHLMRETDVAEQFRTWGVAHTVEHGVVLVDVCRNVPKSSISVPSVFFPDFVGVSGGVVQLHLIARPSGPKLWFIY